MTSDTHHLRDDNDDNDDDDYLVGEQVCPLSIVTFLLFLLLSDIVMNRLSFAE